MKTLALLAILFGVGVARAAPLAPGTYAVLVTGQAKVVTTGTAVPLTSTATLANGVVVVAPSSNAATIYVGGATVANTGAGTGNGIAIEPGRSLSVQITSPSLLYINGVAGDWVSYAGN